MASKARGKSAIAGTGGPKISLGYLRRYANVRPDSVDPRDRQYQAYAGATKVTGLPNKVDYGKETGPVGNQGDTGSCVGWACAYGLRRWLNYQAEGRKKSFSVRWVWISSKEIDEWTPNTMFDQAGTSIREAFKVMNKYGTCAERYWRFADELPDADQEQKLLKDAMRHRIGNYYRLNTHAERQSHLHHQGPFVVGVPVHANWTDIDADGLVPEPDGEFEGGHAVLIVGYDNTTGRFRFQNSWGRDWGAQGYGYFTYQYIDEHAWDCWGAEQL